MSEVKAIKHLEADSNFSPVSEGASTPQESGENYELRSLEGSISITTTAAIVEDNNDTVANLNSGRRATYLAFAALVWSMFMEGWNDGTNGPLLPVMQREYHASSHWKTHELENIPMKTVFLPSLYADDKKHMRPFACA